MPLLIPVGAGQPTPLQPLSLQGGVNAIAEADIQALIHAAPNCLPINEIDPAFANPVAICRELVTPVGQIDNFLVTPSGMPILVECKLWRNPEGRREVVGQILDYAKELSRWSSSDLQREVRRRLRREGDPLLDLVREIHPNVDEADFNDALTANLRRGRFLLLIVGEGIREGVEAIAEYLQRHAGLHFSFGLVELPFFSAPDGSRIVAPRILARTLLVTRNVVTVPDGYLIQEPADGGSDGEGEPQSSALRDEQQAFWKMFLGQLRLDDTEQPIPRPARMGYLSFLLPAPAGSSWLTVFRDQRRNEVGVFLSSSRSSDGEYAMMRAVEDWDQIKRELGGTAILTMEGGRPRIIDTWGDGSLHVPENRSRAFTWLAERVNTFVNVFRPRVRSAVAERRDAEA